MSNTIVLIVDKDYLCLKNFLRQNNISSASITKLKQNDLGIVVNGKKAFTNISISKGDIVKLTLPDEDFEYDAEFDLQFKVLFEDEHYILVDKPPYMAIHPTATVKSGTLNNAFAAYCINNNMQFKFRPINRLDKNTSGIVILAKNKIASSSITDIDKSYIAVCHGKITSDGIVDAPIGLEQNSFIKRTICTDGQNALTKYKVLYYNDNYSVVKLNLLSGRTHQIRVHMSHIGHPLVGDDLYGGKTDFLPRQALHCASVCFKNGFSGEKLCATSKLPSDINSFIIEHLPCFRSEYIEY